MKNYVARIPLGNNKFAYHQDPAFRSLGLALTEEVLRLWRPPRTFFHHRSGGHVRALTRHIGNAYFSHVDINRFFYRVKKNRIIRSLKRVGFSFDDANHSAAHSVVRTEDGFCLPYGFAQSPVLASLCLDWSACGQFLRRTPKEFTVSVYVDDLIISHSCDRNALVEFSNGLVESFRAGGFPISEDKMAIGQDEITSFNIRLTPNNLLITRDRIQDFSNDIVMNAANDNVLSGIEGYVRTVNRDQATEIRSAINRAKARLV